jgi:hypothetical protein
MNKQTNKGIKKGASTKHGNKKEKSRKNRLRTLIPIIERDMLAYK